MSVFSRWFTYFSFSIAKNILNCTLPVTARIVSRAFFSLHTLIQTRFFSETWFTSCTPILCYAMPRDICTNNYTRKLFPNPNFNHYCRSAENHSIRTKFYSNFCTYRMLRRYIPFASYQYLWRPVTLTVADTVFRYDEYLVIFGFVNDVFIDPG